MGILALKGLAYTRVPEGESSPYEKTWYIPIEDEPTGDLALKWTLSQGTTAAIPPGEYKFWDRAIGIAQNLTELNEEQIAQIEKASEGIVPLFKA